MKAKIGNWPKRYGNRKVDIQMDRWDSWNVDGQLALIIYPLLVQLRETKHGVPNEFAEVGGEDYKDQQCFDFYTETHNEAFDEGCKRWDDVLDKMIWAFYHLIDDEWEDQYHHGRAEYDWKETDKLYPNPVTGVPEPTYQMIDKNPGKHWYDHVGHQLHLERIQEGIDLFAKYYRNLWD